MLRISYLHYVVLEFYKNDRVVQKQLGCQRTICFLSLAHAQHRQNAFAQNRFFYVFK